MTTPSLVIGLGGSGLKAATFVKKNFYEIHGNQLPSGMAIQVLDTEKDVKWQAGGWGQERTQEHATGPIKIDYGEYVPLTGNVKALGETIKSEQKQVSANPSLQRTVPYRHISTWFQAQYYLDTANVSEQIWNLDEGAGRYRQFGRLGLFTNINDIVRKLKDAMQTIQRATQGRTLYVHVVGSLAGGTGAALFNDVAHLVQRIADDIGYQQTPVILGHFILSEAFRGTTQVKLNEPGVLRNFNGRMYAALRELTRLRSAVISRSGGYPLVYDPRGTGEMKSLLPGKTYDAVYLYDGLAERVQLNRYRLEKGLAPAIADVISAYIDEKSGGAFRSHSVNYNAFYEAYNVPTGAVTYGTVGTYTIDLPMYHITEGWAHQLAKDVLDTLLVPDPASVDKDTGIPSRLQSNTPGGRNLDPNSEVETWVRNSTTSLVSRMVEWGRQAGKTDVIKQQTVDSILALTSEGWFLDLAPSDPRFQDYVANAKAELEGSLVKKESVKYYVDTKQSGGSSQQQAGNLQSEIDSHLKRMVGDSVGVWRREGGDFSRSLIRLGNHHVLEFETSLIKTIRDYLNGADVGNSADQKGGKLGFVIAFLSYLEQTLATAAQTLTMAEAQSQSKRRPQFDAIDGERKQLFGELQKGSGLLGRTASNYRSKSDDLAQFHKADIARVVVHGLAVRLHQSAHQLLEEARLWERVLATSIADNGGAYGLIREGQGQIITDREESATAVRWVIGDSEPGDTYIGDKYKRYVDGQRNEILSQIEWRVNKVDGAGALRIDFAFKDNQPWSRVAGQSKERPAGRRNVAQLLSRCRAPFAQAWDDMSVTSYLYQNYFEEGSKVDQLADRIHRNSGYPLMTTGGQQGGPPMRTTLVRVYQENLDDRGTSFLRQLRTAVALKFGETTTAAQRANSQKTEDSEGSDYLSEIGQPSTDRFKMSFLIYGDLLQPDNIAAFADGKASYHQFSGAGSQWRELQTLPAETHALEIERELDKVSQRRREFDPDVVTVMEEMANFRIAMRCLAYGETDYDWGIGDTFGLLLHRHTPPNGNPEGKRYWRLVLLPDGTQSPSGQIIDAYGRLATPLIYQLSDPDKDPSLLDAFIQLVSLQRDKLNGTPIDWSRVEATIVQAMNLHKDYWQNRQGTGWQLLPNKSDRNGHLLNELSDKAAHTIRLSALIAGIDAELSVQKWAWSKDEQNPPTNLAADREQIAAIRKGVDLWTAIRGVADQELLAMRGRLQQIGVQTDLTPTEMIELGAAYGDLQRDNGAEAPVVRPEPHSRPESWTCSNGHLNSKLDEFCTACGLGKPALVEDMAVSGFRAEPATPTASHVIIEAQMVCENGHPLQAGWIACPICGAPPAKVDARILCLNGHEMQLGWVVCPLCAAPPAGT